MDLFKHLHALEHDTDQDLCIFIGKVYELRSSSLGDGDACIFVQTGYGEFQFIGLKSGNRWSSPSNAYGSGKLIKKLADSVEEYYKQK